jgi:hypothetical protein
MGLRLPVDAVCIEHCVQTTLDATVKLAKTKYDANMLLFIVSNKDDSRYGWAHRLLLLIYTDSTHQILL